MNDDIGQNVNPVIAYRFNAACFTIIMHAVACYHGNYAMSAFMQTSCYYAASFNLFVHLFCQQRFESISPLILAA